MRLSKNAEEIIVMLENSGYEAYAVGGCVRDFLMGRACDDVDITTSATPQQTESVFSHNDVRFIETGLKHGTITAVTPGGNFEVTTYRTDGDYKDNRHPDAVEFVTDIKSDLSRRDFTVNAMAYSDKRGLVDLFGGQDDLNAKIIRAVGDPDKRFKEDALRIMRALRFSSVLSFEIEPETEKALFDNQELLKNVSSERVFSELSKLLLGDNVFNVLMKYREILAQVIPELRFIFNIPQNTKWHIYDVWEHTCKSVAVAPRDVALRLTMLLHDIGKAFSKTTDENGTDHFKGHQKISAVYAQKALERLKVSNEIYDRVMFLVPIHDMHIGTDSKKIKKWLSKAGESRLRDLIEVKRADKLAQNPIMTCEELSNLDITQSELDRIIEEGEPYSLKDLAVNGYDLIELGYSGAEIGEKLHILLEKVIDGSIKNEKQALLNYLKNH